MQSTLYSMGECPYCPGYSDVIVLARRDAPRVVFHCPGCGCAWVGGERFDENAEARDLTDVAPAGVRLPTPKEIHGVTEAAHSPIADAWAQKIERLLPQGSAPPAP